MRVERIRIRNYRSILDTNWIDIAPENTVIIGQNGAGKTVFLKSINKLSRRHLAPSDVPRHRLKDSTGIVTSLQIAFSLEGDGLADLPSGLPNAVVCVWKGKPGNFTGPHYEFPVNSLSKDDHSVACSILTSYMPSFMYMDSYPELQSSISLPEVFDNAHGSNTRKAYQRLLQNLGYPTIKQFQSTNVYDHHDMFRDGSEELTSQLREVSAIGADGRISIHYDRSDHIRIEVESDGVKSIYLGEREQGFKWIVSFYNYLWAELATLADTNAVVLMDLPGSSLHPNKQAELLKAMKTISKTYQLLYSTHSEKLVDSDQLDSNSIIVLEKIDGATQANNVKNVDVRDPESLYPLKAALGCSPFLGELTLLVEGEIDVRYIRIMDTVVKIGNGLLSTIALRHVKGASKLDKYLAVYENHNSPVTVLCDSDNAGNMAAEKCRQVVAKERVHQIREACMYKGSVIRPTIEDMLRDTLGVVGRTLGWDIQDKMVKCKTQGVIEIFSEVCADKGFCKIELVNEFERQIHDGLQLTENEMTQWENLFKVINGSFMWRKDATTEDDRP